MNPKDGDGGDPDSGIGRGDPDAFVVECGGDSECDDGDPCNGEETCEAGACQDAAPLDCDDGVECTVDSCEAFFGCIHVQDDFLCANQGDTCFADGCAATQDCVVAEDCGESDPCVGAFECVQNQCVRIEPLVCEDRGCLAGACQRGRCVFVPDSSQCNLDPNACAVSTCLPGGQCSAPVGVDAFCDDGASCTDDFCDTGEVPSGICSNEPRHTVCDDAVDCTITACAPEDPTAEPGSGCAMRLDHGVCFDGSLSCAGQLCTPFGCDADLVVDLSFQFCDGSACDLNAGRCVFPQDEAGCLALNTPCTPTTWNGEFCEFGLDPCDPGIECVIGFCDVSGTTPVCSSIPDDFCLGPLPIQVFP